MKDPRQTRRVLLAVGFGLLLPFGVMQVLIYLRPDLVGPMLDHEFGYRPIQLERALAFAATATYLFAALKNFESRAWRRLVIAAGAVFFTLPLLLAELFGPIVFAAMFGGAPDP